jgi:hypothetical protein
VPWGGGEERAAWCGISDYLHIPRSTLRYYPAVAARLKQVVEG